MRQTFKKEERLKSSKTIKLLFSRGNSFLVHPVKVDWIVSKDERKIPARVLIGTSKKYFRKASERNHIKRLLREAYRKNKYLLHDYLNERKLHCDFSLIYIGKAKPDFSVLEGKIIESLERLITEIDMNTDNN